MAHGASTRGEDGVRRGHFRKWTRPMGLSSLLPASHFLTLDINMLVQHRRPPERVPAARLLTVLVGQ